MAKWFLINQFFAVVAAAATGAIETKETECLESFQVNFRHLVLERLQIARIGVVEHCGFAFLGCEIHYSLVGCNMAVFDDIERSALCVFVVVVEDKFRDLVAVHIFRKEGKRTSGSPKFAVVRWRSGARVSAVGGFETNFLGHYQ